jgi:asparagine synthase (glutamine-hydrolysing)
MAAIAGIAIPNATDVVIKMLDRSAYRGSAGCQVRSLDGVSMGVRWSASQAEAERALLDANRVEDAISDSHFAHAQVTDGKLTLTRDPLGVSPLYYGSTAENVFCFASEVKALVGLVRKVREVPPGCTVIGGVSKPYYQLSPQSLLEGTRLEIAAELRHKLVKAVEKRARHGLTYGAWLSGGLDSSILAAIAQDLSKEKMHTFAAGFSSASDLEYARIIARHLRTKHHEIVPTIKEAVNAIPQVIFHLESFDLFLVRSSIMNYFVAKMAADFVPAIFTGEGSDELFGGYAYLRKLPLQDLSGELVDITSQLHNTALQRVDRCSAAFGTISYVPYLDQDIVDYAMRIPTEYKIYDGHQKWILRRAVYDLLPQSVVNREEEKFWKGAGLLDQVARMAAEKVTDSDFQQLRAFPDGETLRSKEEAFYYRIFREYFGELEDFSWMGRTKNMSDDTTS